MCSTLYLYVVIMTGLRDAPLLSADGVMHVSAVLDIWETIAFLFFAGEPRLLG